MADDGISCAGTATRVPWLPRGGASRSDDANVVETQLPPSMQQLGTSLAGAWSGASGAASAMCD
jgi:hypothetical protein